MKILTALVLALAVVSATASCKASDPVAQSDRLIIENATILDGNGGPAITGHRVVIVKDLIVDILPDDAPVPDGQRIDGGGGYLVPGFIDMHAHLLIPRCRTSPDQPLFDRELSERVLSRQLDYGITTIRSPATPTVEGIELRDALNEGHVRGPRAFASAEFINDRRLGDDALRALVRDAASHRADYVKAYAALTPHQVSVLAEAADAEGIPLIGHLQATSWREGVELGVDHLAHAVDWSPKSLPDDRLNDYVQAASGRTGFLSRLDWLSAFDPEGAKARDLVTLLASTDVSVDLTLIALDGKFSSPDNPIYRQNRALNDFPELRSDWEGCANATADWTRQDYDNWQRLREKLFSWVRQMHDGGVLLVSGSDANNQWIAPGEGLHREFELLAEAGLSPNDILKMTGANAALALGSEDVGLIQTGRRADLVLLTADPSRNISNTRSIQWVMQGGKIKERPKAED